MKTIISKGVLIKINLKYKITIIVSFFTLNIIKENINYFINCSLLF